MANPTTPQNNAEKNAQKYFRKADQNDTLAKQSRKKERAADAAKTAKLRGLRLAKEQSDKDEADKVAAERAANQTGAPHPTKAKRVTASKPPAMRRMTY